MSSSEKNSANQERHIRPPDVDELTWESLKNVTRWMLVKKYGPTVEQLKQEQQLT